MPSQRVEHSKTSFHVHNGPANFASYELPQPLIFHVNEDVTSSFHWYIRQRGSGHRTGQSGCPWCPTRSSSFFMIVSNVALSAGWSSSDAYLRIWRMSPGAGFLLLWRLRVVSSLNSKVKFFKSWQTRWIRTLIKWTLNTTENTRTFSNSIFLWPAPIIQRCILYKAWLALYRLASSTSLIAFSAFIKRNGKHLSPPSGEMQYSSVEGMGAESFSASVKDWRVKLIARYGLGNGISSSWREGRRFS